MKSNIYENHLWRKCICTPKIQKMANHGAIYIYHIILSYRVLSIRWSSISGKKSYTIELKDVKLEEKSDTEDKNKDKASIRGDKNKPPFLLLLQHVTNLKATMLMFNVY